MRHFVAACVWTALAAAGPFGVSATAETQGGDVAVVTGLAGEVRYRAADDGAVELKAFQQIAGNTIVELEDGAVLTMVFFSGRKERWEGPAMLRIETEGAVGLDDSAARAVTTDVADDVPRQLETLPHVIGNARSAVTVVLAPAPFDLPPAPDCRHWRPLALLADEAAAIDAARARYTALRAAAPADDFTADAWWLSVLGQFDRFEEMSAVLESLGARHPANPILSALAERAARCREFLVRGEG